MNLKHWSILAIVATVFFMRCAVPPLAGGSDNPDFKVMGSITDANGVPASNTLVTLLPGSYNPVTDGPASLVDTTDGLGEYRFAVAKTGAYNIQAVNLTKMSRSLVTGISVTGDTTRVSIAILSAPGAIKVMLPAGANTGNAYAYVPGSGVVSRARGTGDSIILDSVPAGVLPSVNFAPANDSPSSVIRYNVRVLSGDTATILNPSWRYARSIFLNTTSSGAGVAGSVTGFPVLVRLTRSNFDFTQAQTIGGDIRFTKSDNSPLPYEIERWDPVNGLAEVWVKVDTVYGNDSTQFIIMYWGASTMDSTGSPQALATPLSNSAAVFDTAEGFQAVLHMNQSAGGKTADATANHYDGALSGGAAAGSAAGPIGSACNFTGSSGNIQLTGTAKSKLSFPQYGAYTIAAWVSVDSLFTGDQHLVGKGGLQYSLRAKGSASSPPSMFSFEEYVMTPVKGLDRRLSPITLSTWKHVVAVRNGTSAYLYVDGLCTDSTGIFYGDGNPGNARDSSSDVTIGSLIGGGLHFNGSIDEVIILSVPLSADFVKLCYMNQRSDDKLTVFK